MYIYTHTYIHIPIDISIKNFNKCVTFFSSAFVFKPCMYTLYWYLNSVPFV